MGDFGKIKASRRGWINFPTFADARGRRELNRATKIRDRGAGSRPRSLLGINKNSSAPLCLHCLRGPHLPRSISGVLAARSDPESHERIRRYEPDDAITNVNAPRPDVPLPTSA